MEEYYFLFILAGAWMIFAAVHDFRTREIPNWGNFSLIAIALAYRAFYSISSGRPEFFFYGAAGTILFVGVGFALYYGRAFAGGDAKLLMALGAILPFEGLSSYLTIGLGFVFLLFLVGAGYSLIYSLFLLKGEKRFPEKFRKASGRYGLLAYAILAIGALAAAFLAYSGEGYLAFSFFILGLMPLFYFYAKAIDESFMIKLVRPEKLTEGDWLAADIRIGKMMIKKSVHGLSRKEIEMLKRAKKKVLIRDGIPFAISFLIAFMVFAFLFLFSGFSFSQLF